jgi:hypothetical protein
MPNVRDSFALDYNPDYDKELILSAEEAILSNEQSIANLTKMALSKLGQTSNSKKKKKTTIRTKSTIKSPNYTIVNGDQTPGMFSHKSKSTLYDSIKKGTSRAALSK